MTKVDRLAQRLIDGDRQGLAQAITLVESTRPSDRGAATELLQTLSSKPVESTRIGVSGVPGVGKSSLIDKFGMHCIELGHRVAVLAVDPSSTLSGGSILGDKTRMATLSRDERAFVRPSPTGGTLGGVTRRTRETMTLCEAAGYDMVFVETVGVGQSETAVADMTDMFLLMLLPAGGDELQGIKRGIVELADLVLINKCDGDLKAAAQRSAADYRNALRLLHSRWEQWSAQVLTCSAIEGDGLAAIYETIQQFIEVQKKTGAFDRHRKEQAVAWLWQETSDMVLQRLREDRQTNELAEELEAAVYAGTLFPSAAAQRLVNSFFARTKQG